MFFWISLTRTWSTSLPSTNQYELMLLGFPRHALLLILDDAFVWNFESEFWFTAKSHIQLCECVHSPLYLLGYHVGVCTDLLKVSLLQRAIACFLTFRGLLTQNVVLM